VEEHRVGKWIVCSAWPYVNTIPHLGTFIHLLSADVFSRYLSLKGEDVISVTGSDEHGTPIEVEAIKKGVPPKQLTDEYHATICDLLEKYQIRFTNYTRTENPVHRKYVQEFYRKVYDNGFIYTETVNLPFCPKDGRFLPDRFVEGICPHCGQDNARGDQCDSCGRVLDPLELKSPRCAFCGTPPTVKPSKHWFFDLPKFTDSLNQYIDSNAQLPENARNFSKRWLQEGLHPRALTRDNRWGIPAPFPGAEGKTIYVWLEAVLGYVSAAVEWAEKNGRPEDWKTFWFDKETRNVHFIGKDNIPFHTIIFPALLLATKDPYVLPWQVSSTEFILFDNKKFSKSHRIGVWMDEALRVAPADYWRYILIAIRPETKDANFTWKDFQARVNADLNDVLGNFIHRTLTFIKNNFSGSIPAPGEFNERDKAILTRLEGSPKRASMALDQCKLREGLSAVIDLARDGNLYLSESEPWHTVKRDPVRARTTMFICAQLVRSLAILLAPFLPSTAASIWSQVGLQNGLSGTSWEEAGEIRLREGHVIGDPVPLFKKISDQEIKSHTQGAT
jgi:methionyl-tRNA synthetase